MPKEKPTTKQPPLASELIIHSQEFGRALAWAPDRETPGGLPPTSVAMGAVAARLVTRYQEGTNSGYLDELHRWYNFIAQTPPMVDAMSTLDGEYFDYSYEDWNKAKLAAVRFNHALRCIIDHSPSMTRSELLAKVNQETVRIVPNTQTNRFRTEVRRSVTGMQQELFTEHALWSIDGVDVFEEVSDEDDRNGIDIRFSYEGREYAFDVKSSPEKAQEAEKQLKPGDSTIPFFTGLRGSELGEYFRPSDEQVATIRERILAVLNEDASAQQAVS